MSKKLPYIPWYVKDWLTDAAVSAMSPPARGVWFDWLNHMWADNQCGKLTGSKETLSKLGRCEVAVVDSVLQELVNTKAGIVTQMSGVVTVLNRRMHRLFKSRESNKLRKRTSRARARSPGPVTGDMQHPLTPSKNSLIEFARDCCSVDAETFEELRELVDDDGALLNALEAVANTEGQGRHVRNWSSYIRTVLRHRAGVAEGGMTFSRWQKNKEREAEARQAREEEQREFREAFKQPNPEPRAPNPEPAPDPWAQRKRRMKEFLATPEGKAKQAELMTKKITPADFENAIAAWLEKNSATENTEVNP